MRMFLTRSVMGWMMITVLAGLLLPPVWSAVKVIQPYRATSVDGTARVQCLVRPPPSSDRPSDDRQRRRAYLYPDPEEVRVALLVGLHGDRELCSSVVNLTEPRGTGVKKDREVQCSVQVTEGALEVTVSGLKSTHTDLYRCQIEVLYPPPYLRLTGNGTLVHVLGDSDCPVQELRRAMAQHQRHEEEEVEGEGDEMKAPLSAPVVVLVTLVMFVLVIIIYFQMIQCQQARRETVRTISGGCC